MDLSHDDLDSLDMIISLISQVKNGETSNSDDRKNLSLAIQGLEFFLNHPVRTGKFNPIS